MSTGRVNVYETIGDGVTQFEPWRYLVLLFWDAKKTAGKSSEKAGETASE
jgi:hypothetical protein